MAPTMTFTVGENDVHLNANQVAVLRWARMYPGGWFTSGMPKLYESIYTDANYLWGVDIPGWVKNSGYWGTDNVSFLGRNGVLKRSRMNTSTNQYAYCAEPASDWEPPERPHWAYFPDISFIRATERELRHTANDLRDATHLARRRADQVNLTQPRTINQRVATTEGKVRWLMQRAHVPNECYDMHCTDCGHLMSFRVGRYGGFYGCSQYPDCSATVNSHRDGTPILPQD